MKIKINPGPRLDILSDEVPNVSSYMGVNPLLLNEHKHRIVSISNVIRKRCPLVKIRLYSFASR